MSQHAEVQPEPPLASLSCSLKPGQRTVLWRIGGLRAGGRAFGGCPHGRRRNRTKPICATGRSRFLAGISGTTNDLGQAELELAACPIGMGLRAWALAARSRAPYRSD